MDLGPLIVQLQAQFDKTGPQTNIDVINTVTGGTYEITDIDIVTDEQDQTSVIIKIDVV